MKGIDPSARIIWIHAASWANSNRTDPDRKNPQGTSRIQKSCSRFSPPSRLQKSAKITIRPTTSSPADRHTAQSPPFSGHRPTQSPSSSKYEFWINLLTGCAARSIRSSYRPSSAATRSSSAPTEAIGAWHSKVSTRSSFRTTIQKLLAELGFDNVVVAGTPASIGLPKLRLRRKNRHRTVQRRHPSVDRRLDLGTDELLIRLINDKPLGQIHRGTSRKWTTASTACSLKPSEELSAIRNAPPKHRSMANNCSFSIR